ncbi:MAG: hypothetical protein AAGC71_05015 [Pseudomonadota bacterium]
MNPSKPIVYIALIVVLIVCLWIGWSDTDLQMSQSDVREGIRSTIRQFIQVAVKFVIPAAILVFFAKEVVTRLSAKAE